MVSASDALITISDNILNQIDELNRVEYNKKGRKYKFVNNNFQRIREEDKHLIIYPENLEENLSIISSYSILTNINDGAILNEFHDFCLSIIGVAKLLEINQWYEEENSSVINYKISKFQYDESLKEQALNYYSNKNESHLEMGLNLLVCAKLNFLHTDHHIGTKLEGYYMKHFINKYFGIEALNSNDVLVALKSFVHWGNIKGILYKLEVPNINIDEELKLKFDKFPDPLQELKLNVYDRYPSGTSKYSLIRKSIDILADYRFSKLIPYPTDETFDLNWIYDLCHNIETNPIKYHLRSSIKGLCVDSVNLNELSANHSKQIKNLLNFISLIINIFDNTGGEFLLQNSKIPKFNDNLINNNKEFHDQLIDIKFQIDQYEQKNWDADDIILRLATSSDQNLFDRVMEMREKYVEDYE
ncbi:hypothetical protein HYPBUDRAFT_146914 [Hyphopichia burtonii NRRL Y-1933]|uniref:Uncharacterized protein n=1 Tax=Hyphopichia burtonii NRRL Y-1933 TaxID=984485 RepID=A0A1E4RM34_9ASCO|nr:hypothetical protein HYPBUDRAFT_146914 [Hyphopichia burtonii NRRL Y-1933]ODV68322.1 hypothetical protein HYPBUDRAFT_146914 [Hyphopichia burtonii NRRL Y-1933]